MVVSLKKRFIFLSISILYMISEFNIFKGQVVLNYFLDHPNTLININELAKKLKISTKTSKEYIDILLKKHLLLDKSLKNNKIVCLNNSDKLIKTLKIARMLSLIKELNLEKEINNSFYIFGSCANGTYNEKSDLDIFVIKQKEYNKDEVISLASKIRLEVNIKDVPYYKLNEYIKKNKEFITEVKKGIYFGDESYEL